MAIKERKQITGTTAQIQAYAGHEGQIVWDKEKKTFVGMSGTAGKNYPLAQQAYVDTQFLPLTGGELTGSVAVKGMSAGDLHAPIYTTDPSKELMIATGNADFTKGGGALTLYGRDHEMQGGWALLARSSDDDLILLQGSPKTRSLTWGGQTIDTIEAQSDNGVRYRSGLQICWGRKELTPPTFSDVWGGGLYEVNVSLGFSFPYPFKEIPSTQVWSASELGNSIPLESWHSSTTGISRAWFWFPSHVTSDKLGAQYIAIGRWK